MKLEKSDVFKGVEYIATQKLAKQLTLQGFRVELDKQVASNIRLDLYAEKVGEKHIYEIKIANNISADVLRFKQYQEYAKRIGAEFFVIYVNTPQFKTIEFDSLEAKLADYFHNELPGELDELSTHTILDEVLVDEIAEIHVREDGDDLILEVSGNGTMSASMQIGSDKDNSKGDGMTWGNSFPFTFRALIEDGLIQKLEYDIDTSNEYE